MPNTPIDGTSQPVTSGGPGPQHHGTSDPQRHGTDNPAASAVIQRDDSGQALPITWRRRAQVVSALRRTQPTAAPSHTRLSALTPAPMLAEIPLLLV